MKVQDRHSYDAQKRGYRIAQRRKALKLTQKELAELCGVHVMVVSKWERGIARPAHKLIALARALQTDPTWLDSGLDWGSEVNRFFSLPKKNRDALLGLFMAFKLAELTQQRTEAGQVVLQKDAKAKAKKWFAKHQLGLAFNPHPSFLKASEKARAEGTKGLSDLEEEKL